MNIPDCWFDSHAVLEAGGFYWPVFRSEDTDIWYRYKNNARTPHSLPGEKEHYASEEQAKANLLAHFNEYGHGADCEERDENDHRTVRSFHAIRHSDDPTYGSFNL